MVSECPRGLEVGRHVDQLPFDALEVADRLAELFALLGVLDRRVECAPRDDVRHDRGPEPLLVQGLQLPFKRRLAPSQDFSSGTTTSIVKCVWEWPAMFM